MPRKIAIIGAGVVGASLAYRLQGPLADVTVIDAGGGGATAASFGWINASFFHNEDHFQLRAEGLRAYARLARDLNVPVRTTGCLCWTSDGPEDAELDRQAAQLSGLGYEVERLDAPAFRRLEPAISTAPARSLRFPTEAAAEPGALCQVLLSAAVERGARILSGVRVTSLVREGVMDTTAGEIRADDVIVAAGTGAAALLASLGLTMPMRHSPAYVVETKPISPVLSHILASPDGDIRQRPDGVILTPAAVNHQQSGREDMPLSAQDAAEATVRRLRRLLPGQAIDWARVTRAERPIPGDDLPAIGPLRPGLYLAVMHSGLTLAAVAAELAARDILDGPSNATEALLAPFRPTRFEGF